MTSIDQTAERREADSSSAPRSADLNGSLRHVLIVGGSVEQWDALSADRWTARIERIGSVASRMGVRWVTLAPYGPGPDAAVASIDRQRFEIDQAEVIVEPHADGRLRFADAMQAMPRAESVNEASVAATLYEPADAEPDLVVVFGPPTQLPPSLVWELAYAELVFSDTDWTTDDGDAVTTVLVTAFGEFTSRRRRFGGVDD